MSETINNLRVSMATSMDPRFPPDNIVDGSTRTFWMSTGLFPQEFIISLPNPTMVKKVTLWSTRVASWTVSRSSADKPVDFEEAVSQDCEDTDGTLQTTTFSLPPPTSSDWTGTRMLRFTVRKGHMDFCSVHRVVVQGEPLSNAPSLRTMEKKDTMASVNGGSGGERGSVVMVGGDRSSNYGGGPKEITSY